jgi:hypothetical protein
MLMAGMYLMQEREPRAFKGDVGFWHQLALRFAHLGPDYGSYWNDKRQVAQKKYRQYNPAIYQSLAAQVRTVYARWIGAALKRVRDAAARPSEIRMTLDEAMRALGPEIRQRIFKPRKKRARRKFDDEGGTLGRYWKSLSPTGRKAFSQRARAGYDKAIAARNVRQAEEGRR